MNKLLMESKVEQLKIEIKMEPPIYAISFSFCKIQFSDL